MQHLFLDIETEGLDPYLNDVVTIQIMNEAGKVFLIQNTDDARKLKPILESSLIIGHNIKFDSKFMKQHYDITFNHVYDSYIAELVISGGLFAGRKGASLKDLALKYACIELDKTEQTGFIKGQELTESQIKYAALDVQVLPIIYEAQIKQIEENRLEDTIDIEMSCIPGIVWLELSGIPINLEHLQELEAKAIIKKDQAEKKILAILKEGNTNNQKTLSGESIFNLNLNSSVQLKEALNRIGIKVDSTSKEALSKVDHQIIDFILEYKEVEKLLNTFIKKQPNYLNSVTNRIHSNFNQFGAHTGRFTSSKPNMQQQPHNQEWRNIYKSTHGKIVTSDYSQIELRILAQVSQDKAFINAYNNGDDLHKLTASKVFNIPFDEVPKEKRSMAKSVNFGIVYGMSAIGLKSNLQNAGTTITEDEAKQIIENFYSGYPGISKYLENARNTGLNNLCIRNAANRLIRFNRPQNFKEEGTVKRQSQNMPIQSLCADIVKTAIALLHKKLEPMGVKFINTIHDELVFECSNDQAQEVADIVKSEMERVGSKYLIDVPCIAEVSISDTWEK
jgi:DNA polymerase I-like protein with 3'-5' exonuclease and polymerase domains